MSCACDPVVICVNGRTHYAYIQYNPRGEFISGTYLDNALVRQDLLPNTFTFGACALAPNENEILRGPGAPTAPPIDPTENKVWIDSNTQQVTHHWNATTAAWVPVVGTFPNILRCDGTTAPANQRFAVPAAAGTYLTSTVVGQNAAGCSVLVDETYNSTTGAIVGGANLQANTGAGSRAFVGSGNANAASGDRTAIVGGQSNTASGTLNFVGGGNANAAGGSSYNNIMGGNGNTVTDGSYNSIGGGALNDITANTGSTIAGGTNNDVAGTASYATIGGGNANAVLGGAYATIGGGNSNTSYGVFDVIAGGQSNTHRALSGNGGNVIGGGGSNITSAATVAGAAAPGGVYQTIAGGSGNQTGTLQASNYSTIGGGTNNQVRAGIYATIAGGVNNWIDSGTGPAGSYGGNVVGGGNNNRVDATTGLGASYNIIAGGLSNFVQYTGAAGALSQNTIGGGNTNSIVSSVPGDSNTIGGGLLNQINTSGTGALRHTISGGYDNRILGRQYAFSFIGGGVTNIIRTGAAAVTSNPQSNVITGGQTNVIELNEDVPGAGSYNTISGGLSNTMRNGYLSTILGGTGNTVGVTGAQGSYHQAHVIGGLNNTIGAEVGVPANSFTNAYVALGYLNSILGSTNASYNVAIGNNNTVRGAIRQVFGSGITASNAAGAAQDNSVYFAGAAQKLSFHNVPAVARQTLPAVATTAQLTTALRNLGLIA